jgi:hypothetical protein
MTGIQKHIIKEGVKTSSLFLTDVLERKLKILKNGLEIKN